MKKAKVGLFVLIAVIVLFVFLVMSMIGTRNTAVTLEERVEAQYVSNQSSYDNMWKSFVEMTQVTDLQAKQYKEIYTDLITGRYNDSGQLLQMVQEDNPKLDTGTYTRIQQAIEAGRKEFANNQTKVTDMIREYNTYIKVHFVMNAVFRFDAKDARDYIITSERTDDAFKTGKDDVIKLDGK